MQQQQEQVHGVRFRWKQWNNNFKYLSWNDENDELVSKAKREASGLSGYSEENICS